MLNFFGYSIAGVGVVALFSIGVMLIWALLMSAAAIRWPGLRPRAIHLWQYALASMITLVVIIGVLRILEWIFEDWRP